MSYGAITLVVSFFSATVHNVAVRYPSNLEHRLLSPHHYSRLPTFLPYEEQFG